MNSVGTSGQPTTGRGRRPGLDVGRLPNTGPVAALLRAAAVTVAAFGAAQVYAAGDPGVLCPLRRFTGVPCPLCGSTTAFVELGSGSVAGAFAANPVTVLGMLALLLAPLGAGRRWWQLPALSRGLAIGAAVVAAWLWQLERFGLLAH